MIQSNGVETYLSLGSNLGERLAYLKQGIDLISQLPIVEIQKISCVYESEPVGYFDQPQFLNLAACILTSADPYELLRMLKGMERKVGRIHRERWHERELDIDIIFCGDKIIDSDELVIPHPQMHLRRFVLLPLNEIATDFVHPSQKKTVKQLLAECPDDSRVEPIEQTVGPLT